MSDARPANLLHLLRQHRRVLSTVLVFMLSIWLVSALAQCLVSSRAMLRHWHPWRWPWR